MNPLLLGGIFDVGKKLIDRMIPDPEQKAKAELELLKMQQEGDLREMETSLSAIVMEAKSSDPWTSRARPSFMYVFYTVVLSLVIVAPLVGVFFPAQMDAFFANVGKGFQSIPEAMWTTFTIGYLGYAGARTYEKTKR